MKNIRVLIPIFGIISFVIIYFIATLLYPGGSQVDKHSVGFSWIIIIGAIYFTKKPLMINTILQNH